jgi:MFS family permease
MFNLVSGAALLAASVIAGFLWEVYGAEWTFLAGAAFALLTIASLLPLYHRLPNRAVTGDHGKTITNHDPAKR